MLSSKRKESEALSSADKNMPDFFVAVQFSVAKQTQQVVKQLRHHCFKMIHGERKFPTDSPTKSPNAAFLLFLTQKFSLLK